MDIPLLGELYIPTKKQLVFEAPNLDQFFVEIQAALTLAGICTFFHGVWNIIQYLFVLSVPFSFVFHVYFFFCLWLLALCFLVCLRHFSDIIGKLKEETVRSWVLMQTSLVARFISERRGLLAECRENLDVFLRQERDRIEISIHKQEERVQFLESQLKRIQEEWIKLIVLNQQLVQLQIYPLGVSGISEELANMYEEYNLEATKFQVMLSGRPEQILISGS